MRAISQRFMPPAVLLRYALALGLNGHEAESARQLKLICQLWKDRQCDEGRESWAKAQAKFPQLLAILYPPVSP
jgi:hypothetical protein